jgi:hypothetical protein
VAITGLEYAVFSSLRQHNQLPPRPRVLELGESNWYGDVATEQLEQDIARIVTLGPERDAMLIRLRSASSSDRKNRLYDIARVFYDTFLQPASYTAIDPGTPDSKYKFDLNQPVPLKETFDVAINIGTGEHVFNVYQFYKTAHDLTAQGGLMIHSAPFTGWIDHGFYSFQPTFFFDLARANRYHLLTFVIAQLNPFRYAQIKSHDELPALIKSEGIPPNTHINVVFRKATGPVEFKPPTQGYYAGTLSPDAARIWHEHR